jgi:chaperonin cofactor prefoldin
MIMSMSMSKRNVIDELIDEVNSLLLQNKTLQQKQAEKLGELKESQKELNDHSE